MMQKKMRQISIGRIHVLKNTSSSRKELNPIYFVFFRASMQESFAHKSHPSRIASPAKQLVEGVVNQHFRQTLEKQCCINGAKVYHSRGRTSPLCRHEATDKSMTITTTLVWSNNREDIRNKHKNVNQPPILH